MIPFEHFELTSPPRMGSDWFLTACQWFRIKSTVHTSPAIWYPPKEKNINKLRISVVRHPYEWLRSCWFHLNGTRMKIGSPINKLLDVLELRPAFQDFIDECLKEKNFVKNIFDQYQADSVMKLEDFPYAAQEFFEGLGISIQEFERFQIRSPHRPSYRVIDVDPKIDKELRKAVMENETELCQHYEYFR